MKNLNTQQFPFEKLNANELLPEPLFSANKKKWVTPKTMNLSGDQTHAGNVLATALNEGFHFTFTSIGNFGS